MTSETPAGSPLEHAGAGASAAVIEAAATGFPAAVADLGRLVRIPSIAWPAFDQDQVAQSAEMVAALARDTRVFDDVSVRTAGIPGTDDHGQPAVLATRAARHGAPTVMLYAHHDVQPPGDEALWDSPPFEATLLDGRLYGRGTADDKAGVMVHIAALRALTEANPDPDLGLVLFVEGEEEYGSRSFTTFLDDNAQRMAADVIIVADSANWNTEIPALTTTLRGNVTFTLTIRTLEHGSHSGLVGGAVPDAMLAALKLLATLWHDDGSVAVQGLASFAGQVPEYGDDALRRDAGVLDGVELIGRGPVMSRIWHQPSVTITGVDHVSVDAASNTLAPAVRFVVSARIAPGQDAADAFAAIQEHINAHRPFGAEVSYDEVDLGQGVQTSADGWAGELMRTSLREAYGADAIDLGIGGSIPFIADLVERNPNAQVLVTGIEDPNTRAHSANESLHLETFRHAIAAEALFLAGVNSRRV